MRSEQLPLIRARHDAGKATGSDVSVLLALLDAAEAERLALIEAGLNGDRTVFELAYLDLDRYDQWSMTVAGKIIRARAAQP